MSYVYNTIVAQIIEKVNTNYAIIADLARI